MGVGGGGFVSRSSLLSSSFISKDPGVTGTWRAQKLFLALSALERGPRAVGTREGHHLGCVQKESTGDAASDVTRSLPRPFWSHSTGKAPKKV